MRKIVLGKSAPLRCSREHFLLPPGALFCSRERFFAPGRFFLVSITSALIAPAGRLCSKKMAGSVSLEHSAIEMVKMMYSQPIVPEIGWLNLVLFRFVLITET
jgi:hypothetical protein